MKKIILSILLVVLSFHFVNAKPYIRFRYQCDKQIGFCIRFNIEDRVNGVLTGQEIADGYGFLTFKVVNNRFTVIPEVPFSTDGKVIIDNDWNVGEFAAKTLGYSQIIIKRGVYTVTPNEGAYGSVSFDFVGER